MTDETGKVIISLEKGRIRVESEGLDEEMVVNLLAESLIVNGAGNSPGSGVCTRSLLDLHAQEAGSGPQTLTMAQAGGERTPRNDAQLPGSSPERRSTSAGTLGVQPGTFGNPARLRHPLCTQGPADANGPRKRAKAGLCP